MRLEARHIIFMNVYTCSYGKNKVDCMCIYHNTFPVLFMHSAAEDRFDFKESRSKWDEDWDKSKGAFPFSEKLGEISDKIGSTIDDTINMFRKKDDRDDSPDRFRSGPPGHLTLPSQITWKLIFCTSYSINA